MIGMDVNTVEFGLQTTPRQRDSWDHPGSFVFGSGLVHSRSAPAPRDYSSFSSQRVLCDLQGSEIFAADDLYPVPAIMISPLGLKTQRVHANERLIYAAWYLQPQRFTELLKSGQVDINTRSAAGNMTALQWLCMGKMPSGFGYGMSALHNKIIDEMICILCIVPGAELTAPNMEGRTPIACTVQNGMCAPFEALLNGSAGDAMLTELSSLVYSATHLDANMREHMQRLITRRVHSLGREDFEFDQPRRKKSRCEPKLCTCRCCK
mmetsp:Transcript_5452/g.9716  ORF Transcript_5452/g.9716 Transcript_5452/m.9716 type:complete len:265 (-) Transcript_5452:254-1048(-)